MPLTQYAITGSLRDALDSGPQAHGTVVFRPYGSHDSRVEDDNVLLGALPPINIKDLPDPYLLDEGAWTVTISTTSTVPVGPGRRPVFEPITVPFTHDHDISWGEIVAGVVTPLPLSPTIPEQIDSLGYARAVSTDGAPITGKTARIVFDSAGDVTDIVLEDI